MTRIVCVCIAAVCLFPGINILCVHQSACAGDEPFTYSTSTGDTGLLEIPTARVMRKNSYRLGFSRIKPYHYYYGSFSPARGLEIGGKITEVLNTDVKDDEWDNYGNFKDKSIDIKYQLVSEGKFTPALALGIMDPHGTRIYSSQYVVASKQIFPFDFTVGFGNGRFGTKPLPSQGEGLGLEIFEDPGKWLDDSKMFWGIQFAPSDKYALMVEYSPVRYHEQTRDPAQDVHFDRPVPSRYNFGLGLRPFSWSEASVSWQRGEEVGFNVSVNFDIGKPLLPLYNPLYRETASDRTDPYAERIIRVLYHSGFSDLGVETRGHELYIQAQNDKYFYDAAAVRIILDSLYHILPEHVEKVRLALTENGVPLFEYTVFTEDIIGYQAGRLSGGELLYLSEFDTSVSDTPAMKRRHRKAMSYHIHPVLETFLNDPSGFFKYRIGVSASADYTPWQGGTLVGGISIYPLNNVSTANEPLSIPVRSDLPLYKAEDLNLERLMFDQINKLPGNIYTKISAGLLEIQYAGIEAEAALPVFGGRILLGLNGSAVRKRAPDAALQLKDDAVKDVFTTAFFNTRINFPENEFSFDIRTGRFLAGDYGARFKASKFINGVEIWAWYTVTDTSIFDDAFNRGYNDKVFGVSIPLRLFTGTDSKTTYNYSLSSWTRDTGQDIEHYNPLFDFIDRDTDIYFKKDWKRGR